MTYQMRDGISIEHQQYAIERCTNREELLNPNAYGIQSVGASTACYRGFYCNYAILDRQLLLMNVNIEPNMSDRLKFKYGRSERRLFGKSPELSNTRLGTSWIYRNLCHSIPYSGGILIVNRNIMMRSRIMIHYPIYVYERVCEAVFELGHLISLVDYSDRMVEIRDQIIKDEKTTSVFDFDFLPCEIERKILAEYFHHQY
jgi:hypothetical protein